MSREEITIKQIENMKHCIGFNGKKVKRRKYEAYRNYYTTSDHNPSWDSLVHLGFAFKRSFENGVGDNPQCYFLTKQGIEFLGNLLECKITEME